MASDRWEKINAIFHEALRQPHASRTDFVKIACGDDEGLREEIEALLAADADAADDFLHPNEVNVKDQLNRPVEDHLVGQSFGNYRLERRIGRGGMGNVYLAVRTEGFRQRVAIKVLKRGMDTDEILQRFRREIRVQAALSKHPNIAAMHDAGTTSDGLPYFVMEYVDGQRIDQYCDDKQLSVRQRLELFRAVCSAVHVAHQHTVIHRDLKPGNILVTPDGRTKLIDFGIAKLTAPELNEVTATPTRTESRLLTPDYASPEQARGGNITTATDIYSLGVILYELLSGHRPYKTGEIAVFDLHRMICEHEPDKPSVVAGRPVRRSAETEELPAELIAERRHASPRQLGRQLRGDLDNIIKNPDRRYATVEQFSEDIGRHLSGLPVDARPVGNVERLWRACQRRPLAASLLVSVLVGSALGIWQLSRLSEQLVRTTELRGAAHQAHVIEEVHEAYTEEVDELKEVDEEAADTMTSPARFAIEFAERIGKGEAQTESGARQIVLPVFEDGMMYARLYSDYPFRKEGTQEFPATEMTDFERKALDFVTSNPDQPYFSFDEDYAGASALRYVQARVMREKCVKCHNEDDDSPKRDWVVDQVGGAVQIIRPLEGDVRRVRQGLRSTFILMGLASGGLLAVSVVVLAASKR